MIRQQQQLKTNLITNQLQLNGRTIQGQKLLFIYKENNINLQYYQKTTNQNQIITFFDIIGVHFNSKDQNLQQLTINYFPFVKKLFKRQRCIKSICFFLEISTKMSKQLQRALIKKITNRQFTKQCFSFLVYFNPAAGSNSLSHLQRLQQFIKHTNFDLQIIQTKGKWHCKQHLSTVDVSKYKGVMIVSGDGLIHEFVNSPICGKIPLCHIPAGSGNAFSKTQTSLSGQTCSTQCSAFLAVKGSTKQFNISQVTLQDHPQPIYSFLGLQWAFLSDIDINSQSLRWCGGLRFQVYSLWRCISLRRYPGRIYFSLTNSNPPSLLEKIDDETFHVVETDFLFANFMNIPFVSDKYEFSPLLKVEDEAIDMQYITNDHGRLNLVKYLLKSDSGSHFDKQDQDISNSLRFGWTKVKSYRIEPLGEGDEKGLYGIDGQAYSAKKVQVRICSRKLRAFV